VAGFVAAVTGLADVAAVKSSGENLCAVDAVDEGERIVCGECGQTKPAQAFYLVRARWPMGTGGRGRARSAAATRSSKQGGVGDGRS
jgi:hypothetical protein